MNNISEVIENYTAESKKAFDVAMGKANLFLSILSKVVKECSVAEGDTLPLLSFKEKISHLINEEMKEGDKQ